MRCVEQDFLDNLAFKAHLFSHSATRIDLFGMVFGLFGKTKKKKTGEQTWTVKEIVRETEDAISVIFDIEKETIAYRPGQFLTLIVNLGGRLLRRPYSLSSSPFTDAQLAITIKRVSGGRVSNHLVDTLKTGNQINVLPPEGRFVLDYSAAHARHLIMVAGGVGITPLFSILKSALAQEPHSRVSLLYCNRNAGSIIFMATLNQLQAKHRERLSVYHALEETDECAAYTGIFSEAIFNQFINSVPSWSAEQTLYLTCGPDGLMKLVEGALAMRSVAADRLRKESFASPQTTTKQSVGPSHTVLIRQGDVEYRVTVGDGKTILDASLDQGIDMPFSCQSGICTACRARVTAGQVKMDRDDALTEDELKEGYVLTCIGHPMSDGVTIEV